MGVFARSWEIAKVTFGVIKEDKELLAFPILSGVFSILFTLSVLWSIMGVGLPERALQIVASEQNIAGMAEPNALSFLSYLLIFLWYVGLAAIATFFNVCVVYTTKIRLAGGNATFKESISFAFSRSRLILLWAAFAATVGMVLKALENARRRAGRSILLKILSFTAVLTWSVVTLFVVPAMVYDNLTPVAALRKSIETLKRTWGESLARTFGMGAVLAAFVFGGVFFSILLFFALASTPVFIVFTIWALMLYLIIIAILYGVLATIFNTILYNYAANGKLPKGFRKELVENAFRRT